MNFDDLQISTAIKQALKRKGFTQPTEVQAKVIPIALQKRDLVGKSRTGTGKTAAFGIPLIQMVHRKKGFQVLIITPTRELARQVKEEISSIAIGSHVKTTAVFGGQNIQKQITLLQRRPEIVVGTPGRILDLINRHKLNLSNTRFLVLDEADIMFDMGFRDEIEKIIKFIPKDRHTMLFSATMPREILRLIDRYLKHDKKMFDLSKDNAPVREVEQFYLVIDHKKKVTVLEKYLKKERAKTLVFCRTKRTVDWLEKLLSRRRISCFAIHGDKKQNLRNKMIEKFKTTDDGILIATDVVARGIHIDDIQTVINFDFPKERETYVHRIGRTARQGKKGKAISFCSNNQERYLLEKIASKNNTRIKQLAI
jgi:ATP-dependent RNA helicase DeaD